MPAARRHERDAQAVGELGINRRAHDDVGVLAAAVDLFHHAAHLGHREAGAAQEAHEHGVGLRQRVAVEQRIGEQLLHGLP